MEIGDDVIISAGAFINFNISSHSLVVGNSCVVHVKVGVSGNEKKKD